VIRPIRDRRTFAELARSGRRARRGAHTLVLLPDADAPASSRGADCRVAFAIGRTVGSAVTRNRVRRRLRELLRARADVLPAGALLVRVAPRAATHSFDQLGRALDDALAALVPPSPPAVLTGSPT
jgi:ribonuclease P protein component